MLRLKANQLGKENPQYSDRDKPISYNMRKNLSLEAEIKSRKNASGKSKNKLKTIWSTKDRLRTFIQNSRACAKSLDQVSRGMFTTDERPDSFPWKREHG